MNVRLIFFLCAIFAKFWLIWESEIVDALDDPHEYVLQILHPINGGLAYPPGTGLVGQLFHTLGIPFRLGIEAFFLLASVLVVRTLFTWPWKSWLSLGLFLLTIFNPAPVELFSHLYSDQVWLIETMLGISCLVLAFRNENKLDQPTLLLAVCLFGLSAITRSVFIPLLASTLLFALFAIALTLLKYRSKNFRRNLDQLAVATPVLIFGICLIYGGICRYNFVHHGYSGISFIDSAEYKKFYLCLQSVGAPAGDTYFAIDENRRKLIAQAGPNSKWFIEQLEANALYKQVGLNRYGKLDIPSGWFHWAAFTATMSHGDYMTAFALFKNIEDEISSSSKQGRIEVRSILPLPDSRIPIVWAAWPEGLRNTIDKMVCEPLPDSFRWKANSYNNPDFTNALSRRTIHQDPLREKIWSTLDIIYSCLYGAALFYLYLIAWVGFLSVLILKWNRIPEFSPLFLIRQFFTLLFLILIFWYSLFDASGMPVLARYMILNHVLLPLLICSYLSDTARLVRKEL